MEPKLGKRTMLVAVTITLTISLIFIVAALSKIDNWSRDLNENSAAVETTVSEPITAVASKIDHWADNASRWKIESKRELEGGWEYRLTRTTPLFRFVDDVKVRLASSDSGTTVKAESQSRLGKGDLGQNPRNLNELLGAIRGNGS